MHETFIYLINYYYSSNYFNICVFLDRRAAVTLTACLGTHSMEGQSNTSQVRIGCFNTLTGVTLILFLSISLKCKLNK